MLSISKSIWQPGREEDKGGSGSKHVLYTHNHIHTHTHTFTHTVRVTHTDTLILKGCGHLRIDPPVGHKGSKKG
ncbi:hypothetical protein EON63_20035 [archaeon]|nr:MAG: hypothetical protein EON63_20035 [archaeon]